jgi:serine/threonine protein kinase
MIGKKGYLGKGTTAKVYRLGNNVTYDKYNDDFAQFDEVELLDIYIQESELPVTISEPSEIEDFRQFIGKQNGRIAKIYYGGLITGSVRKLFNTELTKNKLINALYGEKATADFLTTGPLLGFKQYKVMGACFHLTSLESSGDRKEHVYMTFGSACNNNFIETIDIKQLCKNLLESLIFLQNKNYRHNDIKLDNIVECGGKYKFIDWGFSTPMSEFWLAGDFTFSSPIKLQLAGIPKIGIMTFKGEHVKKIHPALAGKIHSDRLKIIGDEFAKIKLSRPDLIAKYNKSLDVFMIGMCVHEAVIKNNMPMDDYVHIINTLTSLEKPLNAEQALAYINSINLSKGPEPAPMEEDELPNRRRPSPPARFKIPNANDPTVGGKTRRYRNKRKRATRRR